MSELPEHIAKNYRELIKADGRTFDELADAMDRHKLGGAPVAAWARGQAAALRAKAGIDESADPVGRATRGKSTT